MPGGCSSKGNMWGGRYEGEVVGEQVARGKVWRTRGRGQAA